jgi:hypothetical protein
MKTLITCAALLFSLAIPVMAQTKGEGKAKAKATAPTEKKTTYPLYGEVVAVTSKTLTIKGATADRKFTISAATEIHNDGKPATIADIIVGKKVGGLLEKSTDGNDKVLKINIGVSQEPKPRAKAKAGSEPATETKGEPKTKAKATKKGE